ncbi:alkaline phosphatase family protein [Novosphingobium sp.]|uniref:alkaline phosphatase family protein n=1 Tax=Novosphingobium sp. TaxID=1874826 RepID=UPI001DF001BF|nr:alkaline phosphatase family protein [Novosphingobium sp.]MBX9664546.1 alkaline phosphatase family protein [Novosphingobium sp.]
MIRSLMALALLLLPALARAEAPAADQRLILVTMDGTRWQDVFRGPDKALVDDKRFTHPDMKDVIEKAWISGPGAKKGAAGGALMPFLHSLPAKGGILVGNRDEAQCMAVTNAMWFSYPGYNEIFTGRADPAITSNDKVLNRNVTFFEWLARRPGFVGKVLAFGNWDVFPFIINDQRSGVPVNPGFAGRYPTETLTMRAALDALRVQKPRVLYVGLGDTDEFAHMGRYDDTLSAMNRNDDFLAELWRLVEADPAYRGKTTLIVTTDHGRGSAPGAAWTEHGSAESVRLDPAGFTIPDPAGFPGSEQIWFAAIGPGVHDAPLGSACLGQNQIAASALTALGEDWQAFDAGAGAPLPFFTGR